MGDSQHTFGKYRLHRRLAIGGMAEVFLGTVHGEAGFQKPVVIKRLHPHYNEDRAFVQMLVDEARLTAQLAHRNICQVLDLGSVAGSYYMAMEYIAGDDLRTLQDHAVQANVGLPLEAAVYITCEVLAGLDFARRKEGPDGQPLGIIHRDISPQNILVSYEGEVKIIDFGIAKVRTRMVQTEAGVIKGKFRYMAPEQASGLAVDHRTDLFAAAVVLYELLLGAQHSVDLPETEILHRMRTASFDPIRKRRPDVPKALAKVVHRALAKKAKNRYQSAAQFRNALLEFLEARRVRFGVVELAALMRQVFNDERRRTRAGPTAQVRLGSAPGMPAPSAAATPDPFGGGFSPATSAGDDETSIRLGDDDLLTVHGSELSTVPPDNAALAYEPEQPAARQGGVWSRQQAAQPRGGKKDPPRSWNAVQTAPAAGPTPAPRPTARPTLAPSTEGRGDLTRGRAAVNLTEVEAAANRSGSALRTVLGLVLMVLVGGGVVAALALWDTDLMLHGANVDRGPGSAGLDAGKTAALRLRSRPVGAKVFVCGKDTGQLTPAELGLNGIQGCEVVLQLDGHEPYRLPAEVHGGRAGMVVATLRQADKKAKKRKRRRRTATPSKPKPKPISRPARRGMGTLRVTAIQAGTVHVNNKPVGKTPRCEVQLKPGAYFVRVYFPALQAQTATRSITVRAGKTAAIHVEPPR